MKLRILRERFSVCKQPMDAVIDLHNPFTFVSRTDDELSLVCITENVPQSIIAREDGWKAFRIEGELDFGLVGILARIASILAENSIPLFVVSTYNTDYVLVKEDRFEKALYYLEQAGYELQRN